MTEAVTASYVIRQRDLLLFKADFEVEGYRKCRDGHRSSHHASSEQVSTIFSNHSTCFKASSQKDTSPTMTAVGYFPILWYNNPLEGNDLDGISIDGISVSEQRFIKLQRRLCVHSTQEHKPSFSSVSFDWFIIATQVQASYELSLSHSWFPL